MMIDLVTLDLDNTLWHADPVLLTAHEEMVRWLTDNVANSEPLLAPAAWRNARRAVIETQPDIAHHPTAIRRAVTRHLLTPLALNEQQLQHAVDQSFDVFHEARNRITPYPEAVELLQHLAARRIPVIAITNGNADLERIGLAPWFSHIVSAESAGVAKPQRGIFDTALALAGGVDPRRALHAGDHIREDVEAARALGFSTIWVNPEQAPVPEGSAPDHVVHSPTQLRDLFRQLFP